MSDFDTSKFQETGWRAFIKWMKDWYKFEYTDLPIEFKYETIDYVLHNMTEVLSREDVLAKNYCTKCGLCCEEIGCPHYDKETHLCTRHDNQESNVCRLYPWDDEVGFVLTLNCGYQKYFFLNYFDRLFDVARKMRER